jgi:3-carboxy-cis,cis-muconate cycloisomerase
MSIFEGFLSTPEVLEAFSERKVLQAMLDFEAALARAQAAAGLIPDAAGPARSSSLTCPESCAKAGGPATWRSRWSGA